MTPSLAAHRTFRAVRHLPVEVLRDLTEDMQEATWCDGTWSSAWFHLWATTCGFKGYAEKQTCIGLTVGGVHHSLTVDEALEFVALLHEWVMRPGNVSGRGKVGLSLIQGGKR